MYIHIYVYKHIYVYMGDAPSVGWDGTWPIADSSMKRGMASVKSEIRYGIRNAPGLGCRV